MDTMYPFLLSRPLPNVTIRPILISYKERVTHAYQAFLVAEAPSLRAIVRHIDWSLYTGGQNVQPE